MFERKFNKRKQDLDWFPFSPKVKIFSGHNWAEMKINVTFFSLLIFTFLFLITLYFLYWSPKLAVTCRIIWSTHFCPLFLDQIQNIAWESVSKYHMVDVTLFEILPLHSPKIKLSTKIQVYQLVNTLEWWIFSHLFFSQ